MKALGGAVPCFRGCSAMFWGVQCQALGGTVPGFGMCIGRLAVGR